MLYFGLFTFVILVQAITTECATLTRKRREDPAETAKELAAVGGSMAAEAAAKGLNAMKEGMSLQHSEGVTAFGQSFQFSKNFHVGAGDDSKSTSSEEKRRRRSLNTSMHFEKLFAFAPLKQNADLNKDQSVGYNIERQKRQAEEEEDDDEGNDVQDSVGSAKENAKDFLQKVREAWAKIMKRIGQWLDSVAASIQGRTS